MLSTLGQNGSRLQKRDTISSAVCEKRVTIYLKRDTILGEFLILFKLKSILKTRVTNLGEQSAILTSRDG